MHFAAAPRARPRGGRCRRRSPMPTGPGPGDSSLWSLRRSGWSSSRPRELEIQPLTRYSGEDQIIFIISKEIYGKAWIQKHWPRCCNGPIWHQSLPAFVDHYSQMSTSLRILPFQLIKQLTSQKLSDGRVFYKFSFIFSFFIDSPFALLKQNKQFDVFRPYPVF